MSNKKTISDELRAFYVAINDWVETGDNPHNFYNAVGLCSNLRYFVSEYKQADNIEIEQQELFIAADLNSKFPFNRWPDDYDYESTNCTIYSNPARLAWIKEHAKS